MVITKNQIHCRASLGKLTVLFCLQSINLRGAPYELVPGYFVNSLLVLTTYVVREGSGEYVRLRNLVRVSLLTIIKFEVDA